MAVQAVPAIKIEVVDVYTCGTSLTCVANIKVAEAITGPLPFLLVSLSARFRFDLYALPVQVIVDENTTLKVCDVIEYDSDGKVVSLNAFKT